MKKSAEVIVLQGTSCVKENKNTDGLTKEGRTERKMVFNFKRTEIYFIALKNENRKRTKIKQE